VMNFLLVFIFTHFIINYCPLLASVNCARCPSTTVAISESGWWSLCWDNRDCDLFDKSRDWLLGRFWIGGRLIGGSDIDSLFEPIVFGYYIFFIIYADIRAFSI
jgi:hypothetical protein